MNEKTKDTFKTLSKIENKAESIKPTVINDTLIKAYMVQYHRDNKVFDSGAMHIWDLTHLSLSYQSKWPPVTTPSCRHRRDW